VKRLARAAAGLAILLGSAWLAGFLWFVSDVVRPPALPQKADGIVVLTGGADRVATGLRLLEDGCCQRMLISGVGHGAELASLLRGSGGAPGALPANLAGLITLGRVATSTAGNADETAAWAQANHLHSLLVVTAFYHMPRALFELGRTDPALSLHPVPVSPRAAHGGLATLSLLAAEYTKFLASTAGLTRLEHARVTARIDARTDSGGHHA
jgi:uncharacterized SAM-binding protein YcdF (DUF218 family)